LSGVFGLLLQQFVPRTMTTRVPCEAPYEQIPHLCDKMGTRAGDLVVAIWEAGFEQTQVTAANTQFGIGAKKQMQDFYDSQAKKLRTTYEHPLVKPFLRGAYDKSALLAQALQSETAFARLKALPGLAGVREKVEEIELLCTERRLLAEQERLHRILHGWLGLHI